MYPEVWMYGTFDVDNFGDLQFVVAHLVTWTFLSRAQSDGMSLEFGNGVEFEDRFLSHTHLTSLMKSGFGDGRIIDELYFWFDEGKGQVTWFIDGKGLQQ